MEEIVFPNKIRLIRKMHGHSMQELADFLGISLSAVSKIEKGYRRINQAQMLRILEFLDCNVDDIFLSKDHEDTSILNNWKSEGEKRIKENEQTGLKVFGAGIRYLRSKAGKTLSELAKKIGLTISVYHKIEIGQRDIYKDEFSLICKALNIPENKIIGIIEDLAKSGVLNSYLKANKTSFRVLDNISMINRSTGKTGFFKIPLYGVPSDDGNIIINKGQSDLINCPNHDIKYSWQDMYALRLCCRRLGSTFPNNTILYINTSLPVGIGDIAVHKIHANDQTEVKVMVIKEDTGGLYGVLKNPNEKVYLNKSDLDKLEKVVFISVA